MKCLLGTPALLLWLADDPRLGPSARAVIADPANDILVSVVSLWEIVVKMRAGKLEADIREIADAVEQARFGHLGVGIPHLLTLAGLPINHRDPFDHLLLAQAGLLVICVRKAPPGKLCAVNALPQAPAAITLI